MPQQPLPVCRWPSACILNMPPLICSDYGASTSRHSCSSTWCRAEQPTPKHMRRSAKASPQTRWSPNHHRTLMDIRSSADTTWDGGAPVKTASVLAVSSEPPLRMPFELARLPGWHAGCMCGGAASPQSPQSPWLLGSDTFTTSNGIDESSTTCCAATNASPVAPWKPGCPECARQ